MIGSFQTVSQLLTSHGTDRVTTSLHASALSPSYTWTAPSACAIYPLQCDTQSMGGSVQSAFFLLSLAINGALLSRWTAYVGSSLPTRTYVRGSSFVSNAAALPYLSILGILCGMWLPNAKVR